MQDPITRTLLCLVLNWIFVATALGQTSDSPLQGAWIVASETSDPLVILLKPKGEASYFNLKNSDLEVYQGQWSTQEGILTTQWADGSEHRFRRGAFDVVVTYQNPSGQTSDNLTAKAIPEGVLGQWAKPPSRNLAESIETENNFFGLWQLQNEDGGDTFVIVSKDRSAATNVGGSDASGLHGSWIKQGAELHLVWENGDYSILREAERSHNYTRIPAGTILEDATSEFRPIARTAPENAPTKWLKAYRTQQEKTLSGFIFSSRKNARDFYRGNWLMQHPENVYERIIIRKYGGLETSRDSNLQGDWLLSGQNIMLRWDDGMRKILSPAGRGFVYYSYAPGQPLDGVPTLIRPATPEDPKKMSILLTGRQGFAESLLAKAHAAGIQPEKQRSLGPGDWIWPFSRQKSTTIEALLTEEKTSEPKFSNDPWWWPLWSEQTSENEPPTEKDDLALDPKQESTELKNTNTIEPLRTNNNTWHWPF